MDTIKKGYIRLVGIAALLFWLTPGMVLAATCTVDVTNNPDPFITGALSTTSCGLGNDSNDSALVIGSLLGGTWTLIDRDNVGGDSESGSPETALVFSPQPGSTGDWFVDLAGLGFSRLVLTLKDGNTGDANPNAPPPEVQFVWFELDLAGNCIGFGSAPAGSDLCGNWSMWGNPQGNELVAVSHMSLYGTGRRPPQEIPEPDSLLLLGLALLGLGAVHRWAGRRK